MKSKKNLENLPLLERLDKYPETVPDDHLHMLMQNTNGRGRNAQIPAKAFLIWDKRHSPTKGKR